jgi:hypothetical protein
MRMGLVALFAITAGAACSIDDFVEFGGVIGVDDGASEGAFKSQKVDGSEEAHIALKTGASITVPKDGVEETVEIGMQRPADEKAISLVKSLKDYQAIVSAPYVLTPHGTKFKEPVTVEIPITKQTDKKLVMAWLENESDKKWKRLGEPVVKDGTAKLDIDHFSVVILLEEDRANLSDDTGSAADAGAPTSASGGSDTSGARVDASTRDDDPEALLDASRAGSGGTISTPAMMFDSGAPFFDKDAATFPFPFADASASNGADAGAASAGPDAGVLFVDDAGNGKPGDSGVNDAGTSDAGANDAGKAADAAIDAD